MHICSQAIRENLAKDLQSHLSEFTTDVAVELDGEEEPAKEGAMHADFSVGVSVPSFD